MRSSVTSCTGGGAGTDVGARGVPPVGGIGELEDEVVPGPQLGMVAVELDQLRERLRIRLAGHRVRPVDIGFEIRRDVRLELAQESDVELTRRRREVDVGRVDDGGTLVLERVLHVVEDRLDDRAHHLLVVGAGAPDTDAGAIERLVVEEPRSR